MAAPHRKRIRHFDGIGHAHELTFSCYQRLPLLNCELWRGMLAESIRRAVTRHEFRLIAFVFMPEHVHLLVMPERNASTVSDLLRAIKRPYSYRIRQLLMKQDSPLLGRLTVRQRPGVSTFRFWQEGPGYDRNITEATTLKYVVDYLHENPVRRGLCQRAIDWRWSSARCFLDPDYQPDLQLPRLDPLPFGFDDIETCR